MESFEVFILWPSTLTYWSKNLFNKSINLKKKIMEKNDHGEYKLTRCIPYCYVKNKRGYDPNRRLALILLITTIAIFNLFY